MHSRVVQVLRTNNSGIDQPDLILLLNYLMLLKIQHAL